MINKIIIQGNLTRDPDFREFPNGGGSACTIRIASTRKFNHNGKTSEDTTFVKVKTFGKLAMTCRQFLAKGAPVIFVGRLSLDQWEKDGQQKQELYIAAESLEFLPGKQEQRNNPSRPPLPPSSASDRSQYAPPAMPDYQDETSMDDMPF